MYSNSDFEKLFIRYKAEAMPRKSMVQGYKTSNSTGTGPRTDGNGGQSPKGSVLLSYSGKTGKCRILSCKNDDRHPYAKRNEFSQAPEKEERPYRKNSLFFVGSRMADVSAAYHITCRMNGLSALEYLKKFFHEIVKGRKDYENLLPMTIGINTNKY